MQVMLSIDGCALVGDLDVDLRGPYVNVARSARMLLLHARKRAER
jgi:hypothetical protein